MSESSLCTMLGLCSSKRRVCWNGPVAQDDFLGKTLLKAVEVMKPHISADLGWTLQGKVVVNGREAEIALNDKTLPLSFPLSGDALKFSVSVIPDGVWGKIVVREYSWSGAWLSPWPTQRLNRTPSQTIPLLRWIKCRGTREAHKEILENIEL